MDKLDREFQLKILRVSKEHYPEEMSYQTSSREPVANLFYLSEHGLIEKFTPHYNNSYTRYFIRIKITAAGLDFLADDGGLTPSLGVETVKLHSDTVKELMIAKILTSEAEPTVKQELVKKLKELPADAVKELLMTIVNKGIDSIPDVAKWLPTFLHSLQQ